ncbi:helix-turn-helix domain-containing protein [Gracilibacillus sp. D59]|uniref:helix-turn-helix domain-containing protein n=1 Tax=Gracilibacillus sp. D59 TaxID=3457434 RepID=UPI003FCDBC44
MEEIELESHQIATDPLIHDSFTISQFNNRIMDHLEILEKFKVKKTENSFIDEIYYYNTEYNFALSNEYGFIKGGSFKYSKDVKKVMEEQLEVGWKYLPVADNEGYISFFRKLPVLHTTSSQGLLVIQVKKKLFQDYFPSQEHITSLVLDSKDNMLFDQNDGEKHLYTESVLNKIKESESNQGTFYADNKNGNETLYVYERVPRFERTYLSMVQKSSITELTQFFRWMVLSSVLFFLGVGILLTFYTTRRAYSPIKQLLNYTKSLNEENVMNDQKNEINIIRDSLSNLNKEKQKLRNYQEQMEPTLKEWFFQQILDGNLTINNQFYRQCKQYNIPVKKQYVAMVIDLGSYEDKMRIEDRDKPILLYAVRNILMELIDNEQCYDGIDLNNADNNLVAIFHFDEDLILDEIKEKLHQTAAQLRNVIRKYLSINTSIGVGNVYKGVIEVSHSYKEALEALKYRLYKNIDSILFIDDLEFSKKQGMFFYPREFETRILDSLKVGDIDQAEQTLDEFMKATASFESYNSIYQCFHLLLSSIILSLEKKGNSVMDIFDADLFGELKSLHTIGEINQWFKEQLFPLYQRLNDDTEFSPGTLSVKQVCQYINENISEDITLSQCADMVNLTPSYLSRLFKKEVGINFRDFVLRRKVEKAKSICIESDTRVSEIAEAIGYSERNLNRLFQRYVKMTISQYKKEHR